ncbi:MAG: S41 family peptidase [Bacteroidales bacterium]|jgi:hypothetical protein|nr:S41 family peptidase [Bacteroidales bacterium]
MKKINRILLFLAVAAFSCISEFTCQAQKPPKLTKAQMQEDIAFLVQTLKDVNPHFIIREKVTGAPIRAEIDSLAATSAHIKTFKDFYYLGSSILRLCKDPHNIFRSAALDNSNRYITPEGITLTNKCVMLYRKYNSWASHPFGYIDGKYFVDRYVYDKHGKLYFPLCSQILAINDIPVDEYQKKNNIRWDVSKKKYYSSGIFLQNPRKITYQYNDTVKTVKIKDRQINNSCRDLYKEKVLWFEKDSILYIRIPEMDYSKTDFYLQGIRKNKNNTINKVVIDVRYNDGGNDYVWMETLSEIIDQPVFYKEEIYIKDSPIMLDYMKEVRKEDVSLYAHKTIEGEQFIDISETDTIFPSLTSLHYKGKIYVLADENVFSSTLAFISVCNQNTRFITVGNPSGYLSGRSFDPCSFSLPNSKLIFGITPCLDLTGVKNLEDCYDHRRDILVDTKDCNYRYYKECFTPEHLYEYDSYFKKVLEQK